MNALKPEFVAALRTEAAKPGGEILAGLDDVLASTEPSVAIRRNLGKDVEFADEQSLRPVAWAPREGRYVHGDRPRFTFDPALHQGLYYVQDASSMIIATIVKALTLNAPARLYIDACAAPGGKTTAAIDALPKGSLVIANEFDRKRLDSLCDNLMRWGSPGVVVTSGDTSQFTRIGAVADIVALDVPCSGEGMMRKDADAAAQWSPALVTSTAALQRSIIDNMWQALRPGGHLIYSTCTFNSSENEENLRYIIEQLGAEPVDIHALVKTVAPDIRLDGAIASPYPAARFIPGRIEGEGLFMAVVHKPLNSNSKTERAAKPDKPESHPWLIPEFQGKMLKRPDGSIAVVPAEWTKLVDLLTKKLRVVRAGVTIAEPKGRDLVPTHALALSTILRRGAFAECEVDYATAITYLRHEAVALPSDAPRGIVLLTYNRRPLGFVKNLGNRANNLLPAPLAIRSTYIPDTPTTLIKI